MTNVPEPPPPSTPHPIKAIEAIEAIKAETNGTDRTETNGTDLGTDLICDLSEGSMGSMGNRSREALRLRRSQFDELLALHEKHFRQRNQLSSEFDFETAFDIL